MSTFSKTQRLAFGLAVPVVLLGSAAAAVIGFRPHLPWVSAQTPSAQAQSSGCTFLSSPNSTPAFCDTFDQPAGTGNRSGDLNGNVWGASRLSQSENDTQNTYDAWSSTQLNLCGTTISAQPPKDIRICNGHIAEAVTDGDNATTLAMYAKQPFDIGGGRTGTVVFDVNNDTQGPHGAWPEFWYTDQPVPSPFADFPGNNSAPRNGVGLRFHTTCTTASGAAGWTLGSVDVVSNYTNHDSFFNSSAASISTTGCVSQTSASAGTMNHVEMHISQAQIDVYATDAFVSGNALPPLKHLATISNVNLPLTRGVIWINDAHYNGNKFGNQGTHTFFWDNVGFDGPVLNQDRTVDVLDNVASGGGSQNLGWLVDTNSSRNLTTMPVDSGWLANATGALVTFNFWSERTPGTFHIAVNGHRYDQPSPLPTTGYVTQSLAIPVNKADVVAGNNTLTFSTDSSYRMIVMNVDIILLGGGGATSAPATGSTGSPSTPTPAATSTAPAPAPVSINNAVCTITLNGVQQSGTCSGTFAPKP